ncbi:NAD(P)H-dependent oxidoreductase [Aerococcaceae bacterium WGS1372]
MVRTIVYTAHPDIATSSSQQFLVSSGKHITDVEYVDLQSEWNIHKKFNKEREIERLKQFDRIFFQFNFYWYQAPAILKLWMDSVFEDKQTNPQFFNEFRGRELGIVVIAGVKEEHFQAGGREKRTLSELLSPYESFANYYQLKYLPIFSVHQFANKSELEKMKLMYEYSCYLEEGTHLSYLTFQGYLLRKLDELDLEEHLDLSAEQELIFNLWQNDLEDQADEVSELFELTDGW